MVRDLLYFTMIPRSLSLSNFSNEPKPMPHCPDIALCVKQEVQIGAIFIILEVNISIYTYRTVTGRYCGVRDVSVFAVYNIVEVLAIEGDRNFGTFSRCVKPCKLCCMLRRNARCRYSWFVIVAWEIQNSVYSSKKHLRSGKAAQI